MDSDNITPRTTIEGLVELADTDNTEKPERKRKRITRTPEQSNRLSRSMVSMGTNQQKRRKSSLDNVTPKTLIQSYLKNMKTGVPSGRRIQRRRSVPSSLVPEDPQFDNTPQNTPRTMIQHLMEVADTNETERPSRKRTPLLRTPESSQLEDVQFKRQRTRSMSNQSVDIPPVPADHSIQLNYSLLNESESPQVSTPRKKEPLVNSVRRKRFHFSKGSAFGPPGEYSTTDSSQMDHFSTENHKSSQSEDTLRSMTPSHRKSPRRGGHAFNIAENSDATSAQKSTKQTRRTRSITANIDRSIRWSPAGESSIHHSQTVSLTPEQLPYTAENKILRSGKSASKNMISMKDDNADFRDLSSRVNISPRRLSPRECHNNANGTKEEEYMSPRQRNSYSTGYTTPRRSPRFLTSESTKAGVMNPLKTFSPRHTPRDTNTRKFLTFRSTFREEDISTQRESPRYNTRANTSTPRHTPRHVDIIASPSRQTAEDETEISSESPRKTPKKLQNINMTLRSPRQTFQQINPYSEKHINEPSSASENEGRILPEVRTPRSGEHSPSRRRSQKHYHESRTRETDLSFRNTGKQDEHVQQEEESQDLPQSETTSKHKTRRADMEYTARREVSHRTPEFLASPRSSSTQQESHDTYEAMASPRRQTSKIQRNESVGSSQYTGRTLNRENVTTPQIHTTPSKASVIIQHTPTRQDSPTVMSPTRRETARNKNTLPEIQTKRSGNIRNVSKMTAERDFNTNNVLRDNDGILTEKCSSTHDNVVNKLHSDVEHETYVEVNENIRMKNKAHEDRRTSLMTPLLDRTDLGPRHSSPVSRTRLMFLGDENLPDVSMIHSAERNESPGEFLERSEIERLKTPHIGPPRPARPTPGDTTKMREEPTANFPQIVNKKEKPVRKPKTKVHSGTLPVSTIKQTFTHFCKMRVDKDALPQLIAISDDYFDQVAGDLQVFCNHAGRKTIDESDVELLLKRQGFITKNTSLIHLVEKYLPLELRQEIIPMARSGNKIVP